MLLVRWHLLSGDESWMLLLGKQHETYGRLVLAINVDFEKEL
jgi:hypothetical protein